MVRDRNDLRRDSAVEAFRCLMMFGICLLHAVGFSGNETQWLAKMLCPCVNAFVFISGWFGCRFSIRKLVRLYGLGLFCAAIMTTLLVNSPYVNVVYGESWIRQFVRLFKNYWFLHAYAVMLMGTPIIAGLFVKPYSHKANQEVLGKIGPLLFLVYGWSFIVSFHIFEEWLPSFSGVGSYTPLSLLGTYVVARYCRWSGIMQNWGGGANFAV